MRRLIWCLAVMLLALPASGADDKKTPKQQYSALLKEYSSEKQKLTAQALQAAGEEQKKLKQKIDGLPAEFADRFVQIAEDNPKDPGSIDALFWVAKFAGDCPAQKTAFEKLTSVVPDMTMSDLATRLKLVKSGTPEFFEAVYNRIQKSEKDEKATTLLIWVASNGAHTPAGQQAAEFVIDKHIDDPAIETICHLLGKAANDKSVELLNKVIDKSSKPKIKATAALSLGQGLAAQCDKNEDDIEKAKKMGAEAEKYLTMVVDKLAKDSTTMKKSAQQELKALHTRIGATAEVTGVDLEQKKFKLSDYRGKVILLDFWGNW